MSKFKLNPTTKRILNKAFHLMRKYPHHYSQHQGTRPILNQKPDCSGVCGTVGCIAGFIHSAAAQLRLDHPAFSGGDVGSVDTVHALCASKEMDSDDVKKFYHFDNWPREFRFQWYKATNQRSRTAVAIRRMRHWMKTGK